MPKPTKPVKPIPTEPTDPPIEPTPEPTEPVYEATPATLRTMLQAGAVPAGKTLWLLGGTYSGRFESFLSGTPEAPITIRQKIGQTAVFDGDIRIRGQWTIWQDFEVMQSVADPLKKVTGIEVLAGNNSLRNLYVHDCGQGIGSFDSSPNTEIYGCIVVQNGVIFADGSRKGHGIYLQSLAPAWKLVENNIVARGNRMGFHVYGEGGHLDNITLKNNIAYDNYETNFHVGGTKTPIQNLTLFGNVSRASGKCTYNVGYLAKQNTGLHMTENTAIGGHIQVKYWTGDITFRENTMYTGWDVLFYDPNSLSDVPRYPTADWNNNQYFTHKSNPFVTNGAGMYTFSQWQAVTGWDADSTLAVIPPETLKTWIHPNRYEPGRAHVAVYDRGGDSISVSLDLNAVLSDGQSYEIYRIPDLTTPVITGVHAAGALTGIPLDNLEFSAYLVKGTV